MPRPPVSEAPHGSEQQQPDGTGAARQQPDGTGAARQQPDGTGAARQEPDGTGAAGQEPDGTGAAGPARAAAGDDRTAQVTGTASTAGAVRPAQVTGTAQNATTADATPTAGTPLVAGTAHPAGTTEAAQAAQATGTLGRPPLRFRSAEDAFDALYIRSAGALVRQVDLLTGDPVFARQAVTHAFDLAWQRWPEVACDSDPVGWIRAAAYEYALAPWQRWVPEWAPGHRLQPRAPRLQLEAALLDLPPARRRAVLLYDGLGLDLPVAAAETEATTAATAGRITRAREELAAAVPGLDAGSGEVAVRLGALLDTEGEPQPPDLPAGVREASERGALRRTGAAFALTGLIAAATLLAVVAGPGTHAVRHSAPPDTEPAPQVTAPQPAPPRVSGARAPQAPPAVSHRPQVSGVASPSPHAAPPAAPAAVAQTPAAQTPAPAHASTPARGPARASAPPRKPAPAPAPEVIAPASAPRAAVPYAATPRDPPRHGATARAHPLPGSGPAPSADETASRG